MTLEDIVQKVKEYPVRHVTVTGGEPLAQPACPDLLCQLCDAGYEVSLETSGALDISSTDPRVSRVVDIKTPGSGEMLKNRFANIAHLTSHDQIKFVLVNREDYEWAKNILMEHRLDSVCDVLFSPAYQQLPAGELADWILADRLPVRLQIQLHKVLWGEVAGR